MGVKDSDIKVCSFKTTSPEAIGRNIKACTILSIRSGTYQDFPSERLQFRLNTNIIADFG